MGHCVIGMTEYLEELEERRNKLNMEADAHRKKRDRLNQETKRFAETRDRFNAQVKKLLQEASRFRERRDELNSKVQQEKANRDQLTKEFAVEKAKLDKLKKSRTSSVEEERNLARLKREVKELEFKQQTTVLDADKERDLVERISKIKVMIDKKEKEFEANEEMRETIHSVREAKKRMDDSHHLVNQYADLAQKEHDQMIERFSESDKVRKEADAAQESFVGSKVKADEEHWKHIELIHLVHDLDRLVISLRQRKKAAEKKVQKSTAPSTQPASQPSPVSAKLEAEKIYEKFMRGEKLSTEDLMLLQKYGLL